MGPESFCRKREKSQSTRRIWKPKRTILHNKTMDWSWQRTFKEMSGRFALAKRRDALNSERIEGREN